MKKSILLISLPLLFAIGCATSSAPQKTQLETREFQTRSYPTNDVKLVMKAMLNVLQDEGYIIKSANTDLGLLNATKEMNEENTGQAVFSSLLFGQNARWKKNSIIESTANVSFFGKECRVRVNFQYKSMDNVGNVIDVKQVDDANFYQLFFSKVDKGLFIQKEQL